MILEILPRWTTPTLALRTLQRHASLSGECIYEKDTGVNYKELLNVKASTGAMAAALQIEALRMDYIAQAEATLVNDRNTRRTSGVIAIVDTNGLISNIAL